MTATVREGELCMPILLSKGKYRSTYSHRMRHDDSMAKALRYTIGGLARAAAMRVSTLRFYERKGLLSPVGRSLSNYRWYDQQSLETADFIKIAYASGFSLADIAELLAPHGAPSQQCERVGHIIEARLNRVRLQIDELRCLEAILKADLKACQMGAPGCAVLTQLHSAARAPGRQPAKVSVSAVKRPK